MVVDTSALIALIFNEDKGSRIAKILSEEARSLRMSTVNLAELIVLLKDRQPQLAQELIDEIYSMGIRFVPPSVNHAEMAASARLKYPLNFGDCFAYALAKEEGVSILTLDPGFRKTDISLVVI